MVALNTTVLVTDVQTENRNYMILNHMKTKQNAVQNRVQMNNSKMRCEYETNKQRNMMRCTVVM